MKKVFIVLTVLLAIFAFASCNQDPKPAANPTPASDPASDPGSTEPTTAEIIAAIVEPEWEAGVLRVKSGEDAENESQPNKFQFGLNLNVAAGQSIDFLAKFTDNANSLLVRQYESPHTPYNSTQTSSESISIEELTPDEDGWYSVSVPGEYVVESTRIALTLYVDTGTWASSFVAIKDLKIGGEAVDLTLLDEDADILPFVNAPSELDVLIVRPAAD